MTTLIKIWATESESIHEVKAGIDKLIQEGYQSIMMLSCVDNNFSVVELNSLLQDCPIPIFGGLFPAIIHSKKTFSKGTTLVGLPFYANTFVHREITIDPIDIDRCYSFASDAIIQDQSDLIIFIDAHSNASEKFIDCLFESLGADIRVIGGGAGSLTSHIPCILCNEGVLIDSAVVVGLPVQVSLGLGHGWEVLDGPFLATETHRHDLISIDYRSAFTLYKETIEKHTSQVLSLEDFNSFATHHPIGIADIHDDLIVRDPFASDGTIISCVGDIPLNALIYILKGNNQNIIVAAKESAIQATQSVNNIQLAVIFDCISRAIHLGDLFPEEIKLIASGLGDDIRHVGVMSLGEISSVESGAIRLFNKSTVIGCW